MNNCNRICLACFSIIDEKDVKSHIASIIHLKNAVCYFPHCEILKNDHFIVQLPPFSIKSSYECFPCGIAFDDDKNLKDHISRSHAKEITQNDSGRLWNPSIDFKIKYFNDSHRKNACSKGKNQNIIDPKNHEAPKTTGLKIKVTTLKKPEPSNNSKPIRISDKRSAEKMLSWSKIAASDSDTTCDSEDRYYCHICNIIYDCKYLYEQHIAEKDHEDNLENYLKKTFEGSTTPSSEGSISNCPTIEENSSKSDMNNVLRNLYNTDYHNVTSRTDSNPLQHVLKKPHHKANLQDVTDLTKSSDSESSESSSYLDDDEINGKAKSTLKDSKCSKFVFRCNYCNINTNAEYDYLQHMIGDSHKANLEQKLAKLFQLLLNKNHIDTIDENATLTSEMSHNSITGYHCNYCCVTSNNELNHLQHMLGKPHRTHLLSVLAVLAEVKEADLTEYRGSIKGDSINGKANLGVKEVVDYDSIHICEFCNIKSPTYYNHLQHMLGKKHRANLEQKLVKLLHTPAKGNRKINDVIVDSKILQSSETAYYCGYCDVCSYTEYNHLQHMLGKPHRANLLSDLANLAEVNKPKSTASNGFIKDDSIDEEASVPLKKTHDSEITHYCDICDVISKTDFNHIEHMKGKRHKMNKKQLMKRCREIMGGCLDSGAHYTDDEVIDFICKYISTLVTSEKK